MFLLSGLCGSWDIGPVSSAVQEGKPLGLAVHVGARESQLQAREQRPGCPWLRAHSDFQGPARGFASKPAGQGTGTQTKGDTGLEGLTPIQSLRECSV